MIKITPAAATRIQDSARQGDMQGLPMRIAARREADGSIHYGMGFDDNEQQGDITVTTEGVAVVISATSQPLVDGMTIDFVELEPGTHQFIFLNPNDAHYRAPKQEA